MVTLDLCPGDSVTVKPSILLSSFFRLSQEAPLPETCQHTLQDYSIAIQPNYLSCIHEMKPLDLHSVV